METPAYDIENPVYYAGASVPHYSSGKTGGEKRERHMRRSISDL